jgi:hypothetical protein
VIELFDLSNFTERSKNMTYIACNVKDEVELFDFLARHNVAMVQAEMAANWRYGGSAGFEGYDAVQVTTKDDETLDLNYEDEEIPEDKYMDDTLEDALWLHMSCLVDNYFRELYPNKEKYEATGDVTYNIPEKTIEMYFLVRFRRTRRRADIEAKWNLGTDKPIVNDVRTYKADKDDVEWEKDHEIWWGFETAA